MFSKIWKKKVAINKNKTINIILINIGWVWIKYLNLNINIFLLLNNFQTLIERKSSVNKNNLEQV